MADPKHQPDHPDLEWLLAELARRESGDPPAQLQDADEATLQSVQAQLDTLVVELRQSPPDDNFSGEADCQRAIELVERITLPSELDSQQPELERIGPYGVVSKLSQGGMGTVYKAIHSKLGRTVAIKILPASRTKDAAAIARFEREMAALGKLNHRNIVAATDAGEVDGMHYLVMEYVDGIDLSSLVRRLGPLPIADTCEIARQAALGLKEAYAHGIIHRDIKPSNLMLMLTLTRNGDGFSAQQPQAEAGGSPVLVKILDFGLARLAPIHADADELTLAGQIMGTLKYMAPEQCSGSRDIDVRADIYSLGATMYRLLTGQPPFAGGQYASPLAIVSALANEQPARLLSRRNDLPPQLVTAVERMMAKNPANRFATPDEVATALQPWAGSADLAALLERARTTEEPAADSASMIDVRTAASHAVTFKRPHTNDRPTSRVLLLILVALLTLVAFFAGRRLLWEFGSPTQRTRQLAQWLATQNAVFGIKSESRGFMSVGPGQGLPHDVVQLHTANLEDNTSISDNDLSRFDNIPQFTTLGLSRTNITDEGLRSLGSLPLLKDLFLSGTKVTDSGIAELKRFPKLAVLHLSGTYVTDYGLRLLPANDELLELSLRDCDVTDAGLPHLNKLRNLMKLDLGRTDVTSQGVAKLRQALPDCEIMSNFSDDEIAKAAELLKKASP